MTLSNFILNKDHSILSLIYRTWENERRSFISLVSRIITADITKYEAKVGALSYHSFPLVKRPRVTKEEVIYRFLLLESKLNQF